MCSHRAVDLKAIARTAMEKYGFNARFPESVLREVSAMRASILQDYRNAARDLRTTLWSSIDNHDSMDLDQLEYGEVGGNGDIHILIAIADVDSYVRKDSQTDRFAAHNGTSVYTGVEIFPMLPDQLSKGITSLLPGRERLALVIEYTVRPDGSVFHGGIFWAIVSNKARLIYEEIGDWLEGISGVPDAVRDVSGLEEQIRLQNEAARRMRTYRMDHGALDLDTLEAQAVVEDGTVKDLVIQRQNSARTIIEEFMVAANGTLVDFLGRAGVPMIQRVVRIPKHWDGIVETAAVRGVNLPAGPDAKALSAFLIRQKVIDPERFPDLCLTVVELQVPAGT